MFYIITCSQERLTYAICINNERQKMKQLDILNKELTELRSSKQYQEFTKMVCKQDQLEVCLSRIEELKTLIIAKQQEIIELLSIR
jgi:hypothetical protein